MLKLYSQVCEECSRLITNRYSTSFSLGIKVFASELRSPIYSIYGFVRFADEIVDTFHDKDKKTLLEEHGNISAKDLDLIHIVDTADEVINILDGFYDKHNLSPNFLIMLAKNN